MPDVTGESFVRWVNPPANQTLWPFTFQDGYISQRYVKMRYRRDARWYDVPLRVVDFVLNEDVVRKDLPECELVEIYRDTPKDHALMDPNEGGQLFLRRSRNIASRQSMHVVIELADAVRRGAL